MKKTVLVTGATSGIGEACARRFAQEGCRVIITGRKSGRLAELAEEFTREYNAEVTTLTYDVRDLKAVREALDSLDSSWKEIDILINNAGLALGMDKLQEGDIEDWDIMIDTNVKGMLYMTRALVPAMVERGRGHIINIGSVAGDAAYAKGNVYCATKAAIKALSDGLRIDLVDTPIRVTNLKPGMVETNFSFIRFHGDKERADSVYRDHIIPLSGADIADIAWYAANAPAHVQIAEVLILPTNQANSSVKAR